MGFELDPIYYEKAKARLDAETAETNIFDFFDKDMNYTGGN